MRARKDDPCSSVNPDNSLREGSRVSLAGTVVRVGKSKMSVGKSMAPGDVDGFDGIALVLP